MLSSAATVLDPELRFGERARLIGTEALFSESPIQPEPAGECCRTERAHYDLAFQVVAR